MGWAPIFCVRSAAGTASRKANVNEPRVWLIIQWARTGARSANDRSAISQVTMGQREGPVIMRSPLLSENPADIQQMAHDYVEAKWGTRLDTATGDIVRWFGECLAEAYLAGALDHRRVLDCAKLLVERK
jgi:hypothetical protein